MYGWLLFFLGPILLILGIIGKKYDWDDDWVSGLVVTGIILLLIINVLIVPIGRLGDSALVLEHQVIKNSLTKARDCNRELCALERASILTKIVEINQRIEKAKFWNKHFDVFWKDDVLTLKPIE